MANPRPFAFGNPDPFLSVLTTAATRLVLRLAHGERLANVAFPDLSFVVLALSVRWVRRSPPGSAARRWARFAIWVSSSSITLGIPWSLLGPPSPSFDATAICWGTAALSVLASLYILIFY